MILSSFGQVLLSYCVRHTKLAKKGKPVQVLTILFFAFVCVISANITTNAATFTVTKTADTSDGVCDSDCSFREAIAAAEAAITDDVIAFDSTVFNTAQTITLSNSFLPLTIQSGTGTLTIDGPQTSNLTISGNKQVRILVNFGSTTINRLTMTEGFQVGDGNVFNGGTMVINNSVITDNRALDGGGGIFNRGTLTIMNSQITNNSTIEGCGGCGGGGIEHESGTLTITNSIISGNTSGSTGGGIRAEERGTISINNSVISNNTATAGGGIYNAASNAADNSMNITNTTISGNIATLHNAGGGGIFNGPLSVLNLTNVTITDNTNISSISTDGTGGVQNQPGGTLTVRNTIIANNIANGTASDFRGNLASQGYNLLETTTGTTITGTTTGNVLGQDPQLLPLDHNGGFTQTVALQATSPAVDAGDPDDFPATDQRGVSRPLDGNGDGISRADIGAFELRPAVVSNTDDGGVGSLRQALIDAVATDGVLIFNSGVFGSPQTIILTSGELVVPTAARVSLFGTGADQLTISGNNQSRVLFINPGAYVAIRGITITGGNGIGTIRSGFGGGILNNGGNLTIENSVIRNNTAQSGNGGGIRNDVNGILNLNSSTVRNNSAGGDGGGIMNISNGIVILDKSTVNTNSASSGGGIYNFGLASLHNSTVSGNSAILFGGGILNDGLSGGVLHLDTITIAKNSAVNYGGGVSNESGIVNSANTIIADNTVTGNNSPDFKGTLASQGFNLIENTNGAIITGEQTGNITGVDPQLLPLGNYGGATQTHLLRSTSPAVDKGIRFGATTDQRGLTRPFDNPNVSNAPGGDGSDIGAFERQENDPDFNTSFDFDGDTKTDISIFRPSAGEWWYLRSSDGSNRAFQFGAASDKIVPADYTGDGKTDLALWRESTGEWFVIRSEDNSFYSFPFGTSGDIPTPSDFDGDGTADVAIFRPANATWYIIRSSDGGTTITTFGASGDLPVAADYDGDGKADVTVFRPSTGAWWINRSTAGVIVANFGTSSDKTVPADYTGDGRTDVAFFRPSSGEWFILRSEDSSFYSVPFGAPGDIPAPGDYDGDGAADYAVFRGSNATWYVQQSTNGSAAVSFGAAGDQPIPNAFVR